jgi:hypothetical protein
VTQLRIFSRKAPTKKRTSLRNGGNVFKMKGSAETLQFAPVHIPLARVRCALSFSLLMTGELVRFPDIRFIFSHTGRACLASRWRRKRITKSFLVEAGECLTLPLAQRVSTTLT